MFLHIVTHSLLHRSSSSPLPSTSSPGDLPTSFLTFFTDKVNKLAAALHPDGISPHMDPLSPPPLFSSFAPTTETEVRAIITSMSDSACPLDFLPTKLLKACLDTLLPVITHLINLCLKESNIPSDLKHALISPILKKDSLPKDDLSSYRPISNLNFLSKVLERAIYIRLLSHLSTFPSLPIFQLAYRKYHSVETCLLKIHSDLLAAIDNQKVSALVLLDLSAAFDTVDHTILLTRLSSYFGIRSSALDLICSYLLNRSQAVFVNASTSPTISVPTGVPQGSVLGPLLFTLYTAPLAAQLQSSGLLFHMYADDTQLYISFASKDSNAAINLLTNTLHSVHSWLTRNRLSLNPSKTEFLLVGLNRQREKLNFNSINFSGSTIPSASSARNLGVIFDSALSFDNHISLLPNHAIISYGSFVKFVHS